MIKSFHQFINESQEAESLKWLIDTGLIRKEDLLQDSGILKDLAKGHGLVHRVRVPSNGPDIRFEGDIDPYEEDDYIEWRGPSGERIVSGWVQYDHAAYRVELMLSTGDVFRSALTLAGTWQVEIFAELGGHRSPAEELTELYESPNRSGFAEIILPALSSLALDSMLEKLENLGTKENPDK